MKILDLGKLPIKYVKLLNSINVEMKSDFHKLIENIYSVADESIDWLVNNIISRNNYHSQIFINLCYLELIKEILKKEQYEKIIVLNNQQKEVLETYLHNNVNITIKSKECFKNTIKYKLSPYKNYISNIKTAFLYLSLRNKKRRKKYSGISDITLIDTFFISSMFKDKKYYDKYYQGLISYLSDDQKNKIYFVPTIDIRKNLRSIIEISEKADEQFLYKFDFLLFEDYIRALLSPFIIKKINFNSFKFRDFDIGPILKEDFKRNISISFNSILNYLFFKRLKQNNISLRFVVNWFENQIIDRGFNIGKNYFFKNTPSIGYQSFIVPYEYNFHLQPTDIEFKKKVIPDKIAITGRGLVNDVKKYCQNIEVKIAPAFRFNYIHKKNFNKIKNYKHKNILIALPISITDSKDILRLIFDTNLSKFLKNVNFIFKTHPAFNIKNLVWEFPELRHYDIYFENDLIELIKYCDILVSNNSSSCLEAIANEVPVIIVGSQNGFTQNPIPKSISDKVWEICYTSDELIQAIERLYYVTSDDSYKEIFRQVREEFFEKVSKKNILDFLNF